MFSADAKIREVAYFETFEAFEQGFRAYILIGQLHGFLLVDYVFGLADVFADAEIRKVTYFEAFEALEEGFRVLILHFHSVLQFER